MAVILPCPVCGKSPKIKRYNFGDEHCVQIICKPLFRKQHESALSWSSNAYENAVNLWDARVKNYKEVNRNVST